MEGGGLPFWCAKINHIRYAGLSAVGKAAACACDVSAASVEVVVLVALDFN